MLIQYVRFFLLAITLLSSSVYAADEKLVDLVFRDVRLVDFVRLTYGEILKRNYVLAPSVSSDSRQISVNVTRVTRERLIHTVDALLQENGVKVRDLAGSYYLFSSSTDFAPVTIPSSSAASSPLAHTVVRSVEPSPLPPESSASAPVALDPPLPVIELYRPLSRSADYLRSGLAAFGGAEKGPFDVVVLSGSDERRSSMRKLLETLDAPAASMLMRVALVEFTDGSDNTRNLTGVLRLLGDKLTLGLGGAPATVGGLLTLKTASLDAVFGVIESDSRFRFRSSPYLRVVDGEKARIQVGSDVPTRGALQQNQNSGLVLQSVETRSTGLVLNVAVQVFRDLIRAKVSQELSTVSQTTTSGIDSPTFPKRSIETTLDTKLGEIVVMGGLDEDSEIGTASGLPYVPFRFNRTETGRKSQLMLMLEFTKV
jgi:general secretion pathway protein D